MTPVRWAEIDPAKFERMVAVALNLEWPHTQRIDGAGGDGGRDVVFRDGDRYVIYQLRAYTGRLGSGQNRRRQVETSLQRAAVHEPTEWHLIVPIDHNPSEEAWLRKLQSKYTFPLHWYGLSHLDALMARHPEVSRYFVEGAEAEVVQILREVNAEHARLSSIQQGAERLQALAQRLEEISPFWSTDVSLRDGAVQMAIRPRYAGAERDAPRLEMSFETKFPDTEQGRAAAQALADAIALRHPTTIAPEHLTRVAISGDAALAGSWENVALSISAAEDPNWSLSAILLVRESEGRPPLVSLPVLFTHRTAGLRGGTLRGADPSDCLRLALTLDTQAPSGNMSFTYSPAGTRLPIELLPALRLVQALKQGRVIELHAQGHPLGRMHLEAALDLDDTYVRIVEAAASVQLVSNYYFELPDELMAEDVDALLTAEAYVRGERIEFTWNEVAFTLPRTSVQALLDALDAGAAGALEMGQDPWDLVFAGHRIPLPACTMHLSHAALGNRKAVVAAMSANADEIHCVLTPNGSDEGWYRMRSNVEDAAS